MSRVSDTAKIIAEKRPELEEIEVMLEGLVQHCINLYATLDNQVKAFEAHKKANEGVVKPASVTPRVIVANRRM